MSSQKITHDGKELEIDSVICKNGLGQWVMYAHELTYPNSDSRRPSPTNHSN